MVAIPLRAPRGLAALAVIASLAACGDNDGDGTPRDESCAPLPLHVAAAGDDLIDRLRSLPGVDARAATSTLAGYRAVAVTIDQPVDHDHPCLQRFQQQLTVLHRGDDAPMVLASTGYGNYVGFRRFELTELLEANQIIVEHRYFDQSRPSPARWEFLDIRQAAGDHHRIVELMRPLFTGPWLTTGGSKGGMTSIFHRRFYPDDVDATVPYVAPINRGNPDPRYDAFLDTVGTAECRAAIHALQGELLRNRRAMLEDRARTEARQFGYRYTHVAVGPAVESAVASLEWSFWQYHGVALCGQVPATTASDDDVADFLGEVSPVSSSADHDVEFFAPYVYQVYNELGYPGTVDSHLDGLYLYSSADYDILPAGATMPTFDPTAMDDIVDWFQRDAERFLLVYGQWDPWTAGRLELGAARDSISVTVAAGTHGARVEGLGTGDRDAAIDRLETWAGVTVADGDGGGRARMPAPPRIPAAVLRAWNLAAAR